jgi:hypothetical protein
MQNLFVPRSGGSARPKSATGFTVTRAPHRAAELPKTARALPTTGLGRSIAASAGRPGGIASRCRGRIGVGYAPRPVNANGRGMAE